MSIFFPRLPGIIHIELDAAFAPWEEVSWKFISQISEASNSGSSTLKLGIPCRLLHKLLSFQSLLGSFSKGQKNKITFGHHHGLASRQRQSKPLPNTRLLG